jgi:dipeptidyl aminopeptidase/acylaminoacyl peptidase
VAIAALALVYAAVCLLVALRFTRARRQRPAPWLETAQPVQLPARDGRARIDGWYLCTAPARGAVLFVHGKDGCRGDELKSPSGPLAQALAAAGFAVLAIDLRGHGSSSRARLTYGAREQHDVLGAVDWLRAHGHARVGVLGASMGASTALLAAAAEPAIAAVVADSPFADFAQMIERQFRRLSHLPGFFLPGALAAGRLLTGVDLRRVCPLASAAALAGRPVLVIHSTGDRFVPVADAHAIAAASGADLWTTATRCHIGSYGGAPAAYTARVLGFFNRHLSAPAPA